jgi:hypothetical protein
MTMSKLKEAQLAVILKHNPMRDDYHVGIRKLSDIKTFAEVVNDDESFVYGDFSRQDALNALKTGKITVYSSKGINLGDFVSTSRRMAQDYAGYSGRVYQRTVNLTDVAWINGDEGVYTGPIKLKEEKTMNNIRFDREYPTLGKLKANLIALASKYYPSGVIEIGDIYTGNVRLCAYIPDDPEYGVLNMTVIGDSIATVGDMMKKDTNPKARAFIDAFNEAKKRVATKQQAPAKPVQQAPVQQAPAKPVQQAPAQQAPTQSIPKNYRRIDGSKRKLYHVAGQFYPPYEAVIVAIGDSPQNSEIYTEDGGKFYLGVKRHKLLQQGARAGLQITPINPNNGGSKMALAYYKIALV